MSNCMKRLQPSLRERQHPLIRKLADLIEATWQQSLELAPYEVPAGLGYIENQLEGETLVIENHCYQTPQFRKLHLELAQVGNGLDILHCVMFPRGDYPLPIFGTDIVGARGQIGAAIVDLSPLQTETLGDAPTARRGLPPMYDLALSQRTAFQFSHPRELPGWADIFSKYCTFIRIAGDDEADAFFQHVQETLEIHCNIANQTAPVTSLHEEMSIAAAQQYYCRRQLENDKTRRVLEKSFGVAWADRYMSEMLFDCGVA
jgi:phycocyanobilin:ferredoxin oxidoreductase